MEVEAKMSKIKIAIERPDAWLNSPLDGHRHRQFFANLLMAATEENFCIETADIPFGGDFAPRLAGPDRVLLSYHSIGSSPNVWRLKESYIPPYYYFDKTGYSGWAQIAHDRDLLRAVDLVDQAAADGFVHELCASLVNRNESKYTQSSEAAPAPGYVFFAMQVAEDSVARLARLDTVTLLQALVRESARSGAPLVIKRHPLCKSTPIGDLLEVARRQGVIISNASVHSLLAGARSVVTINSGVGFEALIHGKPVFSAGKSDYESVTTPLRDLDDVRRCFAGIDWDAARARRFVYFYLTHYCVNGADVESLRLRIQQAVESSIRITAPQGSADHFAHLEAVRYFADIEHTRRGVIAAAADRRARLAAEDLELSRPDSNGAVPSHPTDHTVEQLLRTNAISYGLICDLYSRLSSGINGWHELESRNRGERRDDRGLSAFNPQYYQRLHETDAGFQQNNWLLPYLSVFADARIRTLREVGCGNGAFLQAASQHIPFVIGVDWARSPQLPSDAGIVFIQSDITKGIMSPRVDVNCSADVLEHLPFEALRDSITRLHESAKINFHVIACYDDGHSHLSIFHPEEWLFMFRQQDPSYRLLDVTVRQDDVRKTVCVITNWPERTDATTQN
jgi:hypothetical protein